jgi:indole-3-glycerol phosphate synthase
MILDKIVATKKEEVMQARKNLPLSQLQEMIKELAPCRNFREAIILNHPAIIAEVKCASPSRGRFVDNFNPVAIAAAYEENGAVAISVLTDEKYFLGHKQYLTQIRRSVSLPLLRKDFIIDPYQLYESRLIGADAVLLIVRILGQRLAEFIAQAGELGLAALVEVHTAAEIAIALKSKAEIIGINNRNLDTFVTDINTCKELARLMPAGKIAVAESAISSRSDIEEIAKSGINAFLIGEALVMAPDIRKKLRELRGK